MVVEGSLDGRHGLLVGEKLITRCPGKYQSKTEAAAGTPQAAHAEKTP